MQPLSVTRCTSPGSYPLTPARNVLVDGGIIEQTNQVLRNLARVLELWFLLARTRRAGAAPSSAIEADFDGYNETFRSWVSRSAPQLAHGRRGEASQCLMR